MTAHKHNERHVFIASDVKCAVPVLSIVRSLIPYLPKVPPPEENQQRHSMLQNIDREIASFYEWKPHVATLCPEYDPFSLLIEPDPEMEATKQRDETVDQFQERLGDIQEALEEAEPENVEIEEREKKIPVVKKIIEVILKVMQVDLQAEEQYATTKGKKGPEKYARIIFSLSAILMDAFRKFFPKKTKKAKDFSTSRSTLRNKIFTVLIQIRSVSLLIMNSVKVSFLLLLAGIIRYDVLLCIVPASQQLQQFLQIFELQIACFVSASLTAAIALEIATMGKDFFESPGGWIDLFIIIPVVVESWVYSLWNIRTEDASENFPLKHLVIQAAIVLPAKILLLINRLLRVMRGKDAEMGTRTMKQRLRQFLYEEQEARKRGMIRRIDVLWAVRRGSSNDSWYRTEVNELVGKRVRFIPFHPEGPPGPEVHIEEALKKDGEIKLVEEGEGGLEFHGEGSRHRQKNVSELSIDALNWNDGLRKIVWQTKSNNNVAIFFAGKECLAKRLEHVFHRYDTWSQIRGGFIRTHLDDKLMEMCSNALGKYDGVEKETEKEIVEEQNSDLHNQVHASGNQSDKGEKNGDEDVEEIEITTKHSNEVPSEEEVELRKMVEYLREHGNFVFFGYRRGTFE